MSDSSSSIILIGIGTSGSILARGVRRAFGEGLRYLLLDTDARTGQGDGDFVLLGGDRLSGRGTGGDVVAGRMAAEDSIRTIDEHLEGVRLVVVVTALGGGTGGGATFEVLKHLSQNGTPTIVFATTPFALEGEDRQRNARGMISMIEECAHSAFFLPLDSLVSNIDNMDEAFRCAMGILSSGITFFWRLIEKPGYIRLDIERLRHILSGVGRGRFATVTVQGPGRAQEALEKLLVAETLTVASGPVHSTLCGILGGEDLLLSEVGTIANGLQKAFTGESFNLATVNDPETFSGRLVVVVMIFETSSKTAKRDLTGPRPNLKHTPLSLGPNGNGRFQNAEPTIWHGENIDIPTFVRRNINLEF